MREYQEIFLSITRFNEEEQQEKARIRNMLRPKEIYTKYTIKQLNN